MGTWSIKPFGNDTALDWLNDLRISQNGRTLLINTIDSILENYDGSSEKAEEAMAAISIISASTNDPVKGTNTEAKSWINYSGFVPDYSLIEKALTALEIITTKSELFDLWEESDSLKSWLKDAGNIKNVLLSSNEKGLPHRKPRKKGVPRSLYKLLEHYEINPEEKIREKIFQKIKALKDVNEANTETDYTLPLTLVSKYGLLDETKHLLGSGADPNLDSLAFTYACINGHAEVADLLLNAGAEIFGETIMDENTGYSYNPELYKNTEETPKLTTYKYCVALFSVASLGKPDGIDYLISKGADIHQLDLNGESLIHKACYNNNVATLKHLMQLGVDVNISKGIINGNKNSRGETALHYAVGRGNIDAVKLLLENGANPNITDYFHGKTHNWDKTPLDLIEDKNESEMYRLLVEYGAKLAEQIR